LTAGPRPSPSDADPFGAAKHAALRLLALRDRSRGELVQRLSARFPEDVAARVVEDLAAAGYLDDEGLARRLAERFAGERGFGPARIRAELRRRGLSAETAEAAVGRDDPEALLQRGLEAARRHLKRDTGPLDDPSLRRLAGHLERRGFPAGVIRAIVTLSRQGRVWQGREPSEAAPREWQERGSRDVDNP
jgi:regulatory protein